MLMLLFPLRSWSRRPGAKRAANRVSPGGSICMRRPTGAHPPALRVGQSLFSTAKKIAHRIATAVQRRIPDILPPLSYATQALFAPWLFERAPRLFQDLHLADTAPVKS